MFGWGERPTNAPVKHYIGGDKPAAVFTIGQYEVTVPGIAPSDGEAPAVTYCVPGRYVDGNPRRTFPNLEIRDGEMRLPLDDIVGAILARVEPVDIAAALWGNDDVRAAFVAAMVSRWNEMNIGDPDRRAFLAGVKQAIHSQALDGLAGIMGKLEYAASQRWSIYHQIEAVNQTLENQGATRPPRAGEEGPQPLRIRDTMHDPEFKISGPAWNEARDFWRGEVGRQFPMPIEPAALVKEEAS